MKELTPEDIQNAVEFLKKKENLPFCLPKRKLVLKAISRGSNVRYFDSVEDDNG